ncbi:hypothetical protein Wildcat_7 [Mycobacterium phage Wildcat]|uniref:Uncharacterized protein n=2 Tax=Mycobacterium virus Wildcat TaxID=1993859 RepID=Q19Y53_9CAUD|nr:hypothetical protein Wildcat_7 [Mycobacterium phage Wildcat]ABE67612.1 hypothetical protein Wildcat_7 [Mycobacterium phage Wildcat]QGJ89897.1 hypothetical protein PBI_MARYV_7 [Mycobacterium phage MaryV]WKR36020.1 hypothetical protein [Mycobacterium phage Azrael100]
MAERVEGTLVFELVAIFVVLAAFLAGWEGAYLFNKARAKYQLAQEQKALVARANDQNLSKTMESALKTIDECNKQLNPAHSPDCACVYCEIAHGPVMDRM